MRGAILSLAAAVTLGGCATSTPGWGNDFYSQRRAGAGAGGTVEPRLRADLWYSEFSGDIAFQINQPAYVAIFEIRPGFGARLLYPNYHGEDNFLYDGYHQLDRGYRLRSSGWGLGYGMYGPLDWMGPAMSHYGAVYASATYSPFGYGTGSYGRGYGYGPYGYGSYGYSGSPTYLFMVASVEPLMTDRMVGRSLRGYEYASFSPYAAMDRLVDATVRFPLSSEWATAVYIIWPRQRAYYAGYSGWERFTCYDGRTIWLRRGFMPPASCLEPRARTGANSGTGQDSTGTGEPPDTSGSGVIKIPVRPWMPPTGRGAGETPPWPRDRAEGEGPGNTGSTAVPGLRLPVGVTGSGGARTGETPPGETRRPRRGDQVETPAPGGRRPDMPEATQRPEPPDDPPERMQVPRGTVPTAPRPTTPARPERPAPPVERKPQRPQEPVRRPSPPPRPETKPSPPPRPAEPSSRPSPPPRRPEPSSKPSPPPRPQSKPSPPPRPSSRPSPPPRPSRPADPPPKPRDPPPGDA